MKKYLRSLLIVLLWRKWCEGWVYWSVPLYNYWDKPYTCIKLWLLTTETIIALSSPLRRDVFRKISPWFFFFCNLKTTLWSSNPRFLLCFFPFLHVFVMLLANILIALISYNYVNSQGRPFTKAHKALALGHIF